VINLEINILIMLSISDRKIWRANTSILNWAEKNVITTESKHFCFVLSELLF